MQPAATKLNQAYAQIEQLGKLTGHVAPAKALVASMKKQIATILARAPHDPRLTRPGNARARALDERGPCRFCVPSRLTHQAYINRPRGSGTGRPSSRAVSIHSAMMTSTFARASR